MLTAPTSPISSPRLIATSIGRTAAASSMTDWMTSRMTAQPALLSAPRMVVPSVRITSPPSKTGLIPRPGSTVSMWAERRIGSPTPSRRPMTLPCASWEAASPSACSRPSSSRAIASSSPEGESIATRSRNVFTIRSRRITAATLRTSSAQHSAVRDRFDSLMLHSSAPATLFA